jgi:hypothetical protein
MEIIEIGGQALADLLADLASQERYGRIRALRVGRDCDGIKWKINDGAWSPPYAEPRAPAAGYYARSKP